MFILRIWSYHNNWISSIFSFNDNSSFIPSLIPLFLTMFRMVVLQHRLQYVISFVLSLLFLFHSSNPYVIVSKISVLYIRCFVRIEIVSFHNSGYRCLTVTLLLVILFCISVSSFTSVVNLTPKYLYSVMVLYFLSLYLGSDLQHQ